MVDWRELGVGGVNVATNHDYLDFSLALVSQFEGFRGRAYFDTAGILTIGYGFNLRVAGE